MLRTARAEPGTLVLGVDADARGMAEASSRAARALRRGGLPNARFVVAAAESLPAELAGRADRVTVHFPWGSLLRGVLVDDGTVLDGLAMISKPGALLTLLISLDGRDRLPFVDPTDDSSAFTALGQRYHDHGFELAEARHATPADIAASGSSWAKRLGAGRTRRASLLRFRKRLG